MSEHQCTCPESGSFGNVPDGSGGDGESDCQLSIRKLRKSSLYCTCRQRGAGRGGAEGTEVGTAALKLGPLKEKAVSEREAAA